MNCFGCGSFIQSKDLTKSGFIDLKVLEKNPESLCKRCFSIKNYSKDTGFSKDFNPQVEIAKLNIRFSVIVVVVDIFNLSELGRIFKQNKHIIEKNETWIIVNKVDLLPKSVKLNKVREKLIRNLKTKFRFNNIIMFSAHKLINADDLLKRCHEAKKNVYLLGSINSGKSSIANSLLKAGGASEKEFILESHFPHTTLGILEIPISKKHKLIDLPGFISQEVKLLTNDKLKHLNIKGEQRTTTFQLNKGQSIILDNYAIINFVDGPPTAFTFYVKNIVKTYRTSSKNKNLKLDLKTMSTHKTSKIHLEFTQQAIKDLEIPGVGFVRFTTNNQVIEIESIFNISVRNTII